MESCTGYGLHEYSMEYGLPRELLCGQCGLDSDSILPLYGLDFGTIPLRSEIDSESILPLVGLDSGTRPLRSGLDSDSIRLARSGPDLGLIWG